MGAGCERLFRSMVDTARAQRDAASAYRRLPRGHRYSVEPRRMKFVETLAEEAGVSPRTAYSWLKGKVIRRVATRSLALAVPEVIAAFGP